MTPGPVRNLYTIFYFLYAAQFRELTALDEATISIVVIARLSLAVFYLLWHVADKSTTPDAPDRLQTFCCKARPVRIVLAVVHCLVDLSVTSLYVSAESEATESEAVSQTLMFFEFLSVIVAAALATVSWVGNYRDHKELEWGTRCSQVAKVLALALFYFFSMRRHFNYSARAGMVAAGGVVVFLDCVIILCLLIGYPDMECRVICPVTPMAMLVVAYVLCSVRLNEEQG